MSGIDVNNSVASDQRIDRLHAAASACDRASVADRALDAKIALAVFPDLAGLRSIETGVWLHAEGARIRALRYTSNWTAASTLVPAGHWIETDPVFPDRVWVCGPHPRSSFSALNMLPALALAAAALRAQAQHLAGPGHDGRLFAASSLALGTDEGRRATEAVVAAFRTRWSRRLAASAAEYGLPRVGLRH